MLLLSRLFPVVVFWSKLGRLQSQSLPAPCAPAVRKKDVPFEPLAPTSLPEVPCEVADVGFPIGKAFSTSVREKDVQSVGFPHVSLFVCSRVTGSFWSMSSLWLNGLVLGQSLLFLYLPNWVFSTIGKPCHRYCDLKTLNAAVMQLMKLRKALRGSSDIQWPELAGKANFLTIRTSDDDTTGSSTICARTTAGTSSFSTFKYVQTISGWTIYLRGRFRVANFFYGKRTEANLGIGGRPVQPYVWLAAENTRSTRMTHGSCIFRWMDFRHTRWFRVFCVLSWCPLKGLAKMPTVNLRLNEFGWPWIREVLFLAFYPGQHFWSFFLSWIHVHFSLRPTLSILSWGWLILFILIWRIRKTEYPKIDGFLITVARSLCPLYSGYMRILYYWCYCIPEGKVKNMKWEHEKGSPWPVAKISVNQMTVKTFWTP